MRSFSLDLGDVDVAVDELGLPHRWHPFDVPHLGATFDERNQHVDQAMRRFAADRLLDGERMDPDVEDTLRVWTTPDVLLVVRAEEVTGQRRPLYRAASARGAGVVSQIVDSRIEFEIVPADRVLATMLAELPEFKPIPGLREVAVSTTGGRDEIAEEDDDPLAAAPPAGTAAAEKRAMREFAQWPLERFCGFELWVRGRNGLVDMGKAQVVDTEGGRYVVLPAEGEKLRITPSDGAHLRQWLHHRIDIGQQDR